MNPLARSQTVRCRALRLGAAEASCLVVSRPGASCPAAARLVLLLPVLLLCVPATARGDARASELASAWLAERAAARLAATRDADRAEPGLAEGLEPFGDAGLARDVRAVYGRNGGRLVFLARGVALTPAARTVADLLSGVERHGVGSLPYALPTLRDRQQRYETSLASVQRPRTTWAPPAGWTPPGPRDPVPAGLAEALAVTEAAVDRHVSALRALDVHLVAGLVRFVRDTSPERRPSRDALAKTALAIARDPETGLAEWLPAHPQYERLTAAMIRYLELWRGPTAPTVPEDATLAPGDRGGAIGPLRARLAWEGFLPEAGPAVYDAVAEEALRRFQRSRGLPESGTMDDSTLQALNRPADWWVRQLVLGLERWRSSEVRQQGDTYVRVNIPEFRLELREGGELRLAMDVIVGQPQTPTYPLVSVLREFRVNPRWNVPAGVQRREIDTRAAKDPRFLEENHFVVRQRGGVDRYIQKPGPWNWLGRVIVPFHNSHELALHGTLRHHLMTQAQRTYSNGCVNLKDEVAFARYLLEREEHPALGQLDGWLEGWTTRTVRLRRPIPLVIEYQTVAVDDDGLVRFLPDVYRKDRAAMARLTLGDFDRPGFARQP